MGAIPFHQLNWWLGLSAVNNGVGEKARKEENKKTQDKPLEKMSLKARLAEKKAQVAGHGRDENTKNQQREM